jgi:CubicO group peptidase (beta-lactamase class C family)
MIRHKGVIVSESYMNGVDARTKRLGMSMGKTLTSMLIGSLIEQGVISSSALLEDYVPELAGTGYGGGATVQNALDMCVGVDFDGECMQSCRGPPSASPSSYCMPLPLPAGAPPMPLLPFLPLHWLLACWPAATSATPVSY